MDNTAINQIHCQDCLSFMKDLADNTIDCIITSPPYMFQKEYDTHDDSFNPDQYTSWIDEIFKECARILKDGGRMFVNVQPLSFHPTFRPITLSHPFYPNMVLPGVVKFFGRRIITTVHTRHGEVGVAHPNLISNTPGSLWNTFIRTILNIRVTRLILTLSGMSSRNGLLPNGVLHQREK